MCTRRDTGPETPVIDDHHLVGRDPFTAFRIALAFNLVLAA